MFALQHRRWRGRSPCYNQTRSSARTCMGRLSGHHGVAIVASSARVSLLRRVSLVVDSNDALVGAFDEHGAIHRREAPVLAIACFQLIWRRGWGRGGRPSADAIFTVHAVEAATDYCRGATTALTLFSAGPAPPIYGLAKGATGTTAETHGHVIITTGKAAIVAAFTR